MSEEQKQLHVYRREGYENAYCLVCGQASWVDTECTGKVLIETMDVKDADCLMRNGWTLFSTVPHSYKVQPEYGQEYMQPTICYVLTKYQQKLKESE